MRQFLILITLFVIIVNNCFSQDNWQSGYIIKNKNDTIYGLIDNSKDSKKNSSKCYFKKDATSEVQVFNPKDLLAYRFIDGKFFITKKIALSNNDSNQISAIKSVKIEEIGGIDSVQTVFLEFLIQGKVNVYHYRDDYNEDHYFIEKDGVLSELKNTRETQVADNKEAITEKKEYIGLLTYVMQDANMQSDILESELYPESLINIAKKYHNKVCTNEKCIVYEKAIKPVHIVWGVYGGLSYNSINFGDHTTSNYAPGSLFGCKLEFENLFNWDNNLDIVLDLALQRLTNYKLTEVTNHASLIIYNKVEYPIETIVYPYHTVRTNLNVNINTLVLKVPIIVNYTFSKGKIRPYIGLGIINEFALSQNKEFTYDWAGNVDYDLSTMNDNFKSIPTYHLGLIGQVGCKYVLKNNHSIYLELNFERTKSWSDDSNLQLNNILISANVGYAF